MPECNDCGDDYQLDDGCEADGLCHPCAHSVAEGQISKMVSMRDLTIRDLRTALSRLRNASAPFAAYRDRVSVAEARELRAAIGDAVKLLPGER